MEGHRGHKCARFCARVDLGQKLLRIRVLESVRGWGEGGDWGGGGDEFQRVTQTGQLRLSESFLYASVIFLRFVFFFGGGEALVDITIGIV